MGDTVAGNVLAGRYETINITVNNTIRPMWFIIGGAGVVFISLVVLLLLRKTRA